MSKKRTFILATCILLSSSMAIADVDVVRNDFDTPKEAGAYIFTSFGLSHAVDACKGISGNGITCDDRDFAMKIGAGYKFNKFISAEAGYDFLGNAKATMATVGSLQVQGNVFTGAVVLSAPLKYNISPFLKLGAYTGRIKATATAYGNIATGTPDTTFSATRNTSNGFWGIGVNYDVTREVSAVLEFERFTNMGDTETINGTTFSAKTNVDLISAGIKYRF